MSQPTTIDPQDTAALLAYRGRGNPTAAHVSTAISNCFPGLEFDFRAVWKRIFEGVDLHEANGAVVGVTAGSAAFADGVRIGQRLISVNGETVRTQVTGPQTLNGSNDDLSEDGMEWSNSLALLFDKAGQQVPCIFRRGNNTRVTANLTVRRIFEGSGLTEEAADAGVLTQGLCSPWQNDYRECGCYYWAASRPDYVNVEVNAAVDTGHNWMHKGRTAATPKNYVRDSAENLGQLTYEDLFRAWETELRFLRRGQDSE